MIHDRFEFSPRYIIWTQKNLKKISCIAGVDIPPPLSQAVGMIYILYIRNSAWVQKFPLFLEYKILCVCVAFIDFTFSLMTYEYLLSHGIECCLLVHSFLSFR